MPEESLRDMLKRHEGFYVTPYPDTKGILTIGVGWNLHFPLPADIAAYLKEHGEITGDMVNTLLDISINIATRACIRLWPAFLSFNQARHDALIDFVFNVGEGKIKFEFPSFVAAVNRQDWQRAADEIKYSNGLTKNKLSDYWIKLHGERPDSRPAEIYKMIVEG